MRVLILRAKTTFKEWRYTAVNAWGVRSLYKSKPQPHQGLWLSRGPEDELYVCHEARPTDYRKTLRPIEHEREAK